MRHHRPVPEVDPVAALADPPQGLRAEHRAEPRRAVGDRPDEHGRDDGDRREAALVDARLVVVPRQHRHDEQGEGHGPGGVQRRHARPADRVARQGPGERQQRADEQPGRVRVGAVVDARRIAAGREQDRHEPRRGDREHERDDRRAPPSQHRDADAHDERPQQVELLLDGQRPQVPQQRRPRERLEVRLVGEDLVPVVDVEERRDRVGPRRGQVARAEDRHREHGQRDDEERRGEQPPRPPRPERREVDAPRRLALGEQQRRDEEPAQDEEQVHAEEAARQPARPGVVQHDARDGDRADPVEGGDVRQPMTAADAPRQLLVGGAHRAAAVLRRPWAGASRSPPEAPGPTSSTRPAPPAACPRRG